MSSIRVIAFVFFFVSIFGKIICKKIFNPLTIMCGIWSVILFLSSFCLFNLRQARIESYMALALGVICFSFGFVTNFFVKAVVLAALASTVPRRQR